MYASSLDSAVSQRQQVDQKKQQAQSVLKNLTYREDKIQAQLSGLATQISQAQADLVKKKEQYQQITHQLEQTQKDLAEKQAELARTRNAFAGQLKAMYVDGINVSGWQLLFDSKGLDDFLTRMEYVTSLVNYDKGMLSQMRMAKTQISEKIVSLQSLTQQAAGAENAAEQETAKLSNAKAQQQALLNQTKQEEKAKADEIVRMNAEYNALGQKIRELQAQLAKSPNYTGNGSGLIQTWPLPGHYEITDPYGTRVNPITHKKETHTGVDIAASTGTPIHATGDGVVLLAGYSAPWGAYGNLVIIDHGKGVISLYGHQSKVNVAAGDKVKAGQVIGYVGSTGWSTGPHLHFEIRVNDESVNPLKYFN